MQTLHAVGQRLARTDSAAKAMGRTIYAGDFRLEGLLYVKVLRSPYARAKIARLETARAAAMPGVTVLTAADVPGENAVGPIIADQPVLAAGEVRYHGEAVAVAAADSEELAEKAISLIDAEYEQLPAVTDPEEALGSGVAAVHAGGNLAEHAVIRKGDIEEGFRRSDVIIEGTYQTQWVEHAYIEPEAAVARPEADGRLTVWTATQHVHYERRTIARLLGISLNRVRVIQMTTGGGFGGKIWSLCPLYAALAAWHTGRPAKIVYTREESILSTTKRHPYRIHYKSGAKRDGRLQAVEVKLTGDTGPYMVAGRGVMGRSVVQATGPYHVPNVKIDGYLAYTNNPIGGAFRGYGGPQVALAHEIQMDRLAEKLGLCPLEIRARNQLQPGMETATGQVLKNSVGIGAVLRRAGECVREIQRCPSPASPHQKTGVGMAVAIHGVGSIRSGSRGTALVNLLPDGSATVTCGSVDVGQGSDTIFAQIVAEELGIAVEQVAVLTNDSDITPDCEATSGSRVTYISGKAVEMAARNAREAVLRRVAESWNCVPEELELNHGVIRRNGQGQSVTLTKALKDYCMHGSLGIGSFVPETSALDANGLGSPCATYTFAGAVAEVAVDVVTGEVDLLRVINVIDVGHTINPLLAEGQIEGGTAMGVGYALLEEIQAPGGLVRNPDFTDYKVPTAMDFAELTAMVVEEPEPSGPFQAKGFSEVAVSPVAPAILNAIYDATGIRLDRLPANPQNVLAALRRSQITTYVY